MEYIREFISQYESILKLCAAAFIPVAVSVIFCVLDKKTPFGKMSYISKQIIIGVIFGCVAIIGTEWGISMNDGALVNCRDAAPLCAGMLFGGPAGIIAGLIGGIERWIAVLWGVGKFTRVACSVSTAIAGIYAAGLRKFLFENRRPRWVLALATGAVMEVFHLTMVFLTNIDETVRAAQVVKECTVPMITANAASVMLATLFVNIIASSHEEGKNKKERISESIQRRLFICVVVAFVITTGFMYIVQTGLAENDAAKYLKTSNDDIIDEVQKEYARDMSETKQQLFTDFSRNRHVLETGYIIISDKEGNVKGAPDDLDIEDIVKKAIGEAEENTVFKAKTEEGKQFAYFTYDDDTIVISVLPYEEVFETRDASVFVNTFMEVLVFAAMFFLLYMSVKKVVVKNIEKVNMSLEKITEGNLEEKVEVRTNAEFDSLSTGINGVVSTLKNYIDAESEKIAKELEVAKNIQASALPGVFPAFPGRKDFDIFASMTPAKEVGGDFYDFYITEGNKLNFGIADVSGKGIPAAMFMMRAKTMLKSLAESGLEINDVFTEGNNGLCEGNDAGMFVTSWMGRVDLRTGLLEFANAGHNPPLVYHNGKFEYLKTKPGLVLAGMEGMFYRKNQYQLEKGDIVFLYTDGVTEATNLNNELYGEERLIEFLNSVSFSDMEDLCVNVKKDVAAFTGEAPQFDDITMVAFRYSGIIKKEMYFENASIDDIAVISEFSEEAMAQMKFAQKNIIQMNIAVDEIYSNIVRYAYGDKKGPVKVIFEEKTSPAGIMLTFEDEGVPYNPLKKEDPDITLSAEERDIGGLGIFMVKKTMDEMAYEYKNDKNVLHLFKKL